MGSKSISRTWLEIVSYVRMSSEETTNLEVVSRRLWVGIPKLTNSKSREGRGYRISNKTSMKNLRGTRQVLKISSWWWIWDSELALGLDLQTVMGNTTGMMRGDDNVVGSDNNNGRNIGWRWQDQWWFCCRLIGNKFDAMAWVLFFPPISFFNIFSMSISLVFGGSSLNESFSSTQLLSRTMYSIKSSFIKYHAHWKYYN